MATSVDICNLALANLGEAADITSIDPVDEHPHSERCAQFFPLAVNLLLEQHDWRFAMRQEQLTAFSECDRENWEYRYAVPSECLRIIDVRFPGLPDFEPAAVRGYQDYEVAISDDGTLCIYTNIGNAVCRYIKRVDTRAFPASFVTALSWKLSSMLAGAIIRGTEGAKMVQSCEQMYMLTLDQAKGLDAKQSRKWEEAIPPWIRVRTDTSLDPFSRETQYGDTE